MHLACWLITRRSSFVLLLYCVMKVNRRDLSNLSLRESKGEGCAIIQLLCDNEFVKIPQRERLVRSAGGQTGDFANSYREFTISRKHDFAISQRHCQFDHKLHCTFEHVHLRFHVLQFPKHTCASLTLRDNSHKINLTRD